MKSKVKVFAEDCTAYILNVVKGFVCYVLVALTLGIIIWVLLQIISLIRSLGH